MARVAIWSFVLVSMCFAGAAQAQDDPESLLFYSNGTGEEFRWSFNEGGRGIEFEEGDNARGVDDPDDPDGNGEVWPSCGRLVNGSDGAYQYFGYLQVTSGRGEGDGVCPSQYELAYGDRGFIMEPYNPWDTEIEATRQIYVPADADFTRWADRLVNTSDTDQELTVSYQGSFGWQDQIDVYDSSSGDARADTDDNWIVVDDGDEDGGMPAMAMVWQSEDSETKADGIQVYDWGDFNLSFSITIPANATGTVLLFAVQASSRDEAAALAEELSQLGSAGADELDDDMDTLINFVPSEPGAPRVRMNGPHAVIEGGTLVVHATAEDMEGESMTYEWDLDDDGAYDDLAGSLDATVSAVNVDGPTGLRIGLRVTDATLHVVERHTTVSVQNVAPVVSSTAGTTARTGQAYTYQIAASDFALDTIHYSIDEGPPGLAVNGAGLVTWTPAPDGRGPDVPVIVVVSDDDGGSVDHAWNIRISGAPHVQPGGPYRVEEGGEVLLAPIVSDDEGDPITYAWDLDSDHLYTDSSEPTATWSAAGIDGPADGFEVGLVVSDGEFEVAFMIPVEVRNVGPEFLSTPPPIAVVDREWVYTPEVVDAGGDTFEVEVDEDEIPTGMVMDGGTLRWTPNGGDLEIGTIEFTLTAEDEDNGRNRQEITIEVRENLPPPVPVIAYPAADSTEKVRVLRPSIILENVDDPDGDPVQYFIQVDSNPCFCSPALMESGALDEGDLVTQWQLPSDLVLGDGTTPDTFYIRRWTSDGLEESDQELSLFNVEIGAEPDPDEETDEAAGCACRTAGAPSGARDSAGATLGAILVGLFVARRRRTR